MNKQTLIKQGLSEEQAEKALSEWGREMSLKVKNRYRFDSESARKAGKVKRRK